MTVTAGSDVKKFVKQVGVAKVGVMAMPKWGNGPYAGKLGSTSQTVGITAWTKYPEVAADFIMFMHTPGAAGGLVQDDGAFPADNRFNTKLITLPQQKVLFNLVKNGSPYLENFIPPELDAKAYFAQSQLLLGGSTDASQGGRGDREDRAAHPPDAAEADGELQDVVGLVPVGHVPSYGAGGRVTSGTVALSRTEETAPVPARPGRAARVDRTGGRGRRLRLRLLDVRARQDLVQVRRRVDDRELPRHLVRPDLPDGARPQRAPPARGADPRRDLAPALDPALRGAARLALPPLGALPAVRPRDPGDRRRLRAAAPVQRARQPAAPGRRPRWPCPGLARPAALGACGR